MADEQISVIAASGGGYTLLQAVQTAIHTACLQGYRLQLAVPVAEQILKSPDRTEVTEILLIFERADYGR